MEESWQTDPEFLANEAYAEASSLDTRDRIQVEHSRRRTGWFAWVAQRLNLQAGERVLELGCGPGDLWLQTALPDGLQAALTDLSAGMVSEARRRIRAAVSAQRRFSFAVVSALTLSFADETFDLVIALGLMDHVPNRPEMLREVRRVLRPGGRFCASAGGRSHLHEMESLIRPFLPEANYGGDSQRFGLENGEKLLSPFFDLPDLETYEDVLTFNEARPIVAYVLSEPEEADKLSETDRHAFETFVENELAVRGEIRVTSQKGLFTAYRSG